MPGPTTEVLNEDVRELKADVKEVRAELVSLAHTTGLLNGDVRELKADMKEVKADLARLAIAQAEMRTELRITLGLARWGAGLVIATALGSGVSGVWWASGISAEVKHVADVVAASRPQAPLPTQSAPAQPAPVPKAE